MLNEPEKLGPKDFARQLRRNATPAEKVLWEELRSSKTGYKFRRQHDIDDRTFVDFCSPSVKLIIEVDGSSHDQKEDWDPARDKRLEGMGFLVLRFTNEEVLHNTKRVVEAITNACDGRPRFRY